MDRDIILLAVGGLIGALSSLATIFLSYVLEGMRLRRLWQREDQLQMRQKREELQSLFAVAETEQPPDQVEDKPQAQQSS